MITEDYVSSETAKLLKEKGFKEWCRYCYGLDVRHNGESISFDEECELKDEGFGNEIEYVDGARMYDYGCDNFNPGSPYAAPSLYVTMKWLREEKDILIEMHHLYRKEWYAIVSSENPLGISVKTTDSYSSYEEACENAIKYVLENLI